MTSSVAGFCIRKGHFLWTTIENPWQYDPLELLARLLHLEDCGLVTVVPNLVNEVGWAGGKERCLSTARTPSSPSLAGRSLMMILRIPLIIAYSGPEALFEITGDPTHGLSKVSRSNHRSSTGVDYCGDATILAEGRYRSWQPHLVGSRFCRAR